MIEVCIVCVHPRWRLSPPSGPPEPQHHQEALHDRRSEHSSRIFPGVSNRTFWSGLFQVGAYYPWSELSALYGCFDELCGEFLEEQSWTAPFASDDVAAFERAITEACDALGMTLDSVDSDYLDWSFNNDKERMDAFNLVLDGLNEQERAQPKWVLQAHYIAVRAPNMGDWPCLLRLTFNEGQLEVHYNYDGGYGDLHVSCAFASHFIKSLRQAS